MIALLVTAIVLASIVIVGVLGYLIDRTGS
jgi:hypothetical protein